METIPNRSSKILYDILDIIRIIWNVYIYSNVPTQAKPH